jgi:radical SAM superfamily enzyme YgiQ (UPF0313 family)
LVAEEGRNGSMPPDESSGVVRWDFISTYSQKHGAAIGESLGPEAIAGHLQGEYKDSIRVKHHDMQLDPLERILQEVIAGKPDIIGLSVKIGALEQTEQIVEELKKVSWESGKEPLLVLGGVVPTFASSDLLKRFSNVVLTVGEGEVAAAELVKVARQEIDKAQVPGIAYINSVGKLIKTRHELVPLEKLHLPARLTTRSIHQKLRGMIWAEDSRGCDYSCTFCSRKALRGAGFSGGITPEHVVDDLERLTLMGIHYVSFTGDDFCGDSERARKIAEEILQRRLQITWSISTRADHVFERKNTPEENQNLRAIMQVCHDAGLIRVFLGLESGSQSQLKRYGKQITVEENYMAVQILREIGIDVVAGYIPIDYLMTVQELRETLEFLDKTDMGLKVSNPLSVLRVQEGSPYLKLIEHKGLLRERTEDLVFYNADFQDKRIQHIALMADRWVEDLYPLIFGLKGEVATVSLDERNTDTSFKHVENTLYAFRRLELNFLKSLAAALEEEELFDGSRAEIVWENFTDQRKVLLDQVRKNLNSGLFGDIYTSRLLSCLEEVRREC